MSLSLVPANGIQRGVARHAMDIWRIPTRRGPIYGGMYLDGGKVYFTWLWAAGDTASAWRPWTEADRPAVDIVWQSFISWWGEQGYE